MSAYQHCRLPRLPVLPCRVCKGTDTYGPCPWRIRQPSNDILLGLRTLATWTALLICSRKIRCLLSLKQEMMYALSTVTLFLLAALGLLLIPGPSVLYILTRNAAQGRRAGLASVAGIDLASLTHAVAATLGLSALLLTSALAFSVVKYLGAAYLIYLGVRTLLARAESPQNHVPAPSSFSRLCAQGFLVQLLNPKTALFFYAFLPQFVDPARGAVTGQILVFGVLFVLLAF